jgi:hypothetical protein
VASTGTSVQVTGLKELKKRIALGGIAYTPIRKFYNEYGKELKEESKAVLERYEKDDTGKLKASIKYTRRTAQTGALPKGVKVMATAKHASYVHGDVDKAFKGKYNTEPDWSRTKPHFPPVRALKGWAERKGLNPFLVARAISIKGTPIVPFLKIAYDESEDNRKALLLVASKRIELAFKKSRKGKI